MRSVFARFFATLALVGLFCGCQKNSGNSQTTQPAQKSTSNRSSESNRSSDSSNQPQNIQPDSQKPTSESYDDPKTFNSDLGGPVNQLSRAVDRPILSDTLNNHHDSQMSESNVKPFFVVIMGKVDKRNLYDIKKMLTDAGSPKYLSSWQSFEEPVEWSLHEVKMLDRTIIETTPEEMASLRSKAEKVPGLSVIYRPIDHVQASLQLDVLDTDGEEITSFDLGDAVNTVSLTNADLNDPPSYLFVDEDGKSQCHIVDTACLQYLSERGFLSDTLEFNFKAGDGYQRRRASVKEILHYMVGQSLAAIEKRAHNLAATEKIVGYQDVRLLRKHLKNPKRGFYERMIQFDSDRMLGSMILSVVNVKLPEAKSPEGDLPINPMLVYASARAGDEAFVHDTDRRYLFDLPVASIKRAESPTAEAATVFSLKEYYSSLLNALK